MPFIRTLNSRGKRCSLGASALKSGDEDTWVAGVDDIRNILLKAKKKEDSTCIQLKYIIAAGFSAGSLPLNPLVGCLSGLASVSVEFASERIDAALTPLAGGSWKEAPSLSADFETRRVSTKELSAVKSQRSTRDNIVPREDLTWLPKSPPHPRPWHPQSGPARRSRLTGAASCLLK